MSPACQVACSAWFAEESTQSQSIKKKVYRTKNVASCRVKERHHMNSDISSADILRDFRLHWISQIRQPFEDFWQRQRLQWQGHELSHLGNRINDITTKKTGNTRRHDRLDFKWNCTKITLKPLILTMINRIPWPWGKVCINLLKRSLSTCIITSTM